MNAPREDWELLSELNSAIERFAGENGKQEWEAINRLLGNHPVLAQMTDHRGEYPLHKAAYYGCGFGVQRLLEAGADVNAVIEESTKTPLHLAAERGQMEICEQLAIAGADLTRRAANGLTPLLEAIFTRQINPAIGALLWLGAPLDLRAAINLGQCNIVRVLIRDKPSLVREMPDAIDLVAEAAFCGNEGILQLLLEAGAEPNTASIMHHGLQEALNRQDRLAIELLLHHGADPDCEVRPGVGTPRQSAQEQGLEWAMELFSRTKQ